MRLRRFFLQKKEPIMPASRGKPSVDLLRHVGVRGRHTLPRDLAVFVPFLFACIVQQTAVYLAFASQTSPTWAAAPYLVLLLALVPVLSAITLCAFRRHQSPITAAVSVFLICSSFAVSLTAALRIPVTFAGLGSALIGSMVLMAAANIRFHRQPKYKIAVLDFARSAEIRANLAPHKVELVANANHDISEFDAILVDPDVHFTSDWSQLLARCYITDVDIVPWSTFLEISRGRIDVGSFTVGSLLYSPGQILYSRMKRVFDLFAVFFTLPLSIPLAAITSAYIYLRDPGPVLFVQHRCGMGGRLFRVYKFRTMYAGRGGGATGAADSRIIPGLNIIRKLRIDELPQLFNILKGEMSLIGPRPEALDLVKWYRREIPEWDYRTLVMPGLTGWAQVNHGYTSNPAEARIKLSYDLYYIKNLSFDLDLQILFQTCRTVLFGAGAR